MKLIDLSQIIKEGIPVYPGDEPVNLYERTTVTRDGYATYFLSSNLHAGTHMDMPSHILPDKRMASDFSLDHFSGQGILLDVRGQAMISYQQSYEQLVKENSVVVLYTGHDEFYGSSSYFSEHPVITEDFSDFLIRKQVKILGMDMPSPDKTPYNRHKQLLNAEIFLLENLTHLSELVTVDSFELIAMPLKIEAEASFVRAYAKVSNSETDHLKSINES